MKKLILTISVAGIFIACGNDSEFTSESKSTTSSSVEEYDPKRGLGKFENIELGDLDYELAEKGRTIYEMKCQSCHKLTDERLVGPGWDGVSDKHQPAWLLNFITDPDPMIDKDPELQAQLELCLVRMPNQNVSDEEARSILEFMRQNDGVQ